MPLFPSDIPDSTREESALRYSEENYRLVVETAPDAVISIDERGTILFANPATVRESLVMIRRS